RFSPNIDDYNSYSSNIPGGTLRHYAENNIDSDPLFYNSRPRSKPDIFSQDVWQSCESSFYNQSMDSVDAALSVDPVCYGIQAAVKKALRRPSLERQTTLYDDAACYDTGQTTFYTAAEVTQVNYVSSSISFNQNQSCDEYYDSSSFPFQEEMYGQDQEDRQWDSGGNVYNETVPMSKSAGKSGKKLPAIPLAQGHKRRSSTAAMDEGYMGYGDDNFRPSITTPLGRRKMPQIPTKRSSSRQSSYTEDNLKTFETPSHRGASLPPTPTRSSSKVLAKVQIPANSAFNSLPTTPGRQLPKPDPNHRSAKAIRNNRMKRTSSADYGETDTYDNYYIRAGAASAQNYNEDYNYAYRSIEDNLPEEDNLVTSFAATKPSVSETRTSTANNINSIYFNAQHTNTNSYYSKQLGSNSPLLQFQNTDSLESKDDELKESSFETVVSSVNSSNQYNQAKSIPYSDYARFSIVDDGESRTAAHVPESFGDHHSKTKAICDTTSTTSVATTMMNNQTALRNQRTMVKQESVDHSLTHPYLSHQQSIDNTFQQISSYIGTQISDQKRNSLDKNQVNGYQQNQVTGYTTKPISSYDQDTNKFAKDSGSFQSNNISGYPRGALVEQYSEYEEEPYLEAQESIDSYVDEDAGNTGGGHQSDYPKAPVVTKVSTNQHDSPANDSVVDEETGSLRRGSSQITIVDPYHPSLQQRSSVSLGRRTSDSASSRKLSDSYPGFEDTLGRKPSIVDASGIPRRGSVRHSPTVVPTVTIQTDYRENIPEENHITKLQHDDLQKTAYEEDEQKEKVTAHARWLWAFNKILLQIHVSKMFPNQLIVN
ncbi:uncharacterized protein LOC125503292, partial [Dendroctonus ponderosae]